MGHPAAIGEKHASGAEARIDFAAFAARLKSRPDTELSTPGVFPQPVKPLTLCSLYGPAEAGPFLNRQEGESSGMVCRKSLGEEPKEQERFLCPRNVRLWRTNDGAPGLVGSRSLAYAAGPQHDGSEGRVRQQTLAVAFPTQAPKPGLNGPPAECKGCPETFCKGCRGTAHPKPGLDGPPGRIFLRA